MSDQGRWIWYELMSPDIAEAKAFYGEVVGWTASDMPMGEGPPYTIFETDGQGVGGGMPLMEEHKAEGIPPNWTGYVYVEDCDAAAAKVKTLGGTVRREPLDIPGVGRFAVVADPTGAVLCIMKPTPPPGAREMPGMDAVGQCAWHELYAGKLEDAFPFYEALFGWTKAGEFDMGPQGTYLLFALNGAQIGGMMTRPPNLPPCWNFYFRVDDIEAANQRVRKAGGQVFMDPMEVPSGDWVLSGQDPQGAIFSLLGPKKG